MTFKAIYVAGILAICGIRTASAGVVYNNLGTGNDVYLAGGLTVAGANVGDQLLGSPGVFEPAFSFTPTSTAYLTELDIALSVSPADQSIQNNTATVELLSDSSGPGTVLESWDVLSSLPLTTTCCTLQTLAGNGTIALTSGTKYWVAVVPDNDNVEVEWNQNPNSVTGHVWQNFFGFGYSQSINTTVGAFEVQGSASPSPEPGTTALAVAAALALGAAHRRRRN